MWLSQSSHLYFPATERSPVGNKLKWKLSIYWCSCGWESQLWVQSHRWYTTDWFPGLITLAGSGQDAPSFTGPFWKQAAWCLNTHPQVVGSKYNLSFSVSLFQSFLSLLPLLLPWSSHLHSSPLYPENVLLVSLSSVMGIFVCGIVLSVQLLLLVFADIVGMVEHLSLETQTQPMLPETSALGCLVHFKEQKEKIGACVFPSSALSM